MSSPENFQIDNPASVTFKVNPETRTIKGLALPFDVAASNGWNTWQFAKGSLSWNKVKLLNGHIWDQIIGTVELEETDEGLVMSAKVAKTRLGDEVLALAEMGAIDGLSIGLANDVEYRTEDDVFHVTKGTILEVSTTPIPAFEDAQIRSVAASKNHKENPMEDTDKTAALAAVADLQTAVDAKFDALDAKLDKLAEIKIEPASGRAKVKEEPLYRFDAIKAASGRDFSEDFINAAKGDREAAARVTTFMNESLVNPNALKFVDSSDVSDVNPSVYRPDLYKDEAPAQPAKMYETFYAGGLSSVTPFFYSKLDSYSGLIADHVEGTEPAPGSFETEAGATVTPSAVSGRVFLTREMVDQGGSPQVSAMIAQKVQRSFRTALELKTAAVLHGAISNITALASPSTGATGAVIAAALKQGLVDLAFTADGDRFTKFFAAKDLYAQLAAAEDASERPLFPILSPANADGTTSSRLAAIDVAGIKIDPTWSTEIKYGTPGESDDTSYFVDPAAVKVWNSGLTKIDRVNESAAGWNVDVFAYVATHLYDVAGIRKLTYKIS